ncbi:MAG: hypothetical protein QGI83_11630 [Candidatus Latescibacteria bacterium]|nr:hypothetical protein [Candidatus Latescibacterota bacterium]
MNAPHPSPAPVDYETDPETRSVLPHGNHSTFPTWEPYSCGRGLAKGRCREAAEGLGAPLSITKRGCLVWAYK